MQTEQQAFSHESHRYSITTATTLEKTCHKGRENMQSYNTGGESKPLLLSLVRLALEVSWLNYMFDYI